MRHQYVTTILAILVISFTSAHAVGQQPPAKRDVKPVERKTEADDLDFAGRTEAVQRVQVVSRVAGVLEKILFQDGQRVKQGELLFQLDARPQEAVVAQVQAELARAQAELAQSQSEMARMKRLIVTLAASQADYDKAQAKNSAAVAAAEVAKAKCEAARVDLDATRIAAAISGRVGRAEAAVGGQVQPGTALTTIISEDPIHVYFSVPERQYLRLARAWRPHASASAKPPPVTVQIGLAGEQGFAYQGVIDFIDPEVDPKTGTVRFRAVVDNAQRALIPGLSMRVRIPAASVPASK